MIRLPWWLWTSKETKVAKAEFEAYGFHVIGRWEMFMNWLVEKWQNFGTLR